jgi:type IV pilus assembly protein PilB
VAPITYPEKALIDLQVPPDKIGTFQPMNGKGCQRCNGTGYKGRIAAYEIMIFNDQLGEFVLNGASTLEIKREAIRLGMDSLRMAAVKKFMAGMTTPEEVVRSTAPD